MRIISGTCGGRTIVPPKNLRARPTTDFAKENLFNVLGNLIDFEGIDVLDLFAGTGSISYEFASRGAASVTSVEINAVQDIDLWFNNRLAINLKVPTEEKILVSKLRVNDFKAWFSGN